MRKDMFKVIVERPRRGGSWGGERRTSIDESSHCRESVRSRHTNRKWLNENLRPLDRYLQAQVGRPWNKVYSEICAGIDRRSTVQQHIHQHLVDFVAVTVVMIDGEIHEVARGARPRTLAELGSPRFFVDPVTGSLRSNTQRAKARRAWRQMQAADRQPAANRRDLDPFLQLHRLKGNWYEVDLGPIPMRSGATGVFDVVRCRQVGHWKQPGLGKEFVHGDAALYGRDDVYAWSKRQLGAPELRRHGLANAME